MPCRTRCQLMMQQLLFNMMTALAFDDDSSLETDALEVEMPSEGVIKPKAGNIMPWKKNILKSSTKAPYNSIVGLGMIAYDGLLEQGHEALSELEESPVFLIDDNSVAKWCPSTERPDEELTKRKILRNRIIKEIKNNGGRFLQGATSVAESEATSFLQTSNSDAKNNKSASTETREWRRVVSLTAPPVQALHLNIRAGKHLQPLIAHFRVGSAACWTRGMSFGFQVTWSLNFC
jgi:hypothetical protein